MVTSFVGALAGITFGVRSIKPSRSLPTTLIYGSSGSIARYFYGSKLSFVETNDALFNEIPTGYIVPADVTFKYWLVFWKTSDST